MATADWDGYRPHPAMQQVVAHLNQSSLHELLAALPAPASYQDGQVAFDYRIYSPYAAQEVSVVYVLLNGLPCRPARQILE